MVAPETRIERWGKGEGRERREREREWESRGRKRRRRSDKNRKGRGGGMVGGAGRDGGGKQEESELITGNHNSQGRLSIPWNNGFHNRDTRL